LIVLKLRPQEPAGAFEVPILVPALGILMNAALVIGRLTAPDADFRALYITVAIVLATIILYFLVRPTSVSEESLAAIEQ
jgi:hypothetical protein